MNYFSILIIIMTFQALGFAQDPLDIIEKDLARYNDYFVNSDKYEHRKYAHDKFKDLFEKALRVDSSYYYPFDSLKWVSKINAPDNSFRIFTWILYKNPGEYKYFGFFQDKSGKLIELHDNASGVSDLEYTVFDPDDWFGQLYYNIHQYDIADKHGYILFGLRKLDKYNKVKIAAPLVIEDNGIVFGKEVFEDTLQDGGLKNRIVLVTRASAASKLNYDEDMQMIIFDHTIPIPDRWAKEIGMGYVPDGSYHGYYLEGDKWKYKDKIFNIIYKKPPMPKPVIDKNKDILGK